MNENWDTLFRTALSHSDLGTDEGANGLTVFAGAGLQRRSVTLSKDAIEASRGELPADRGTAGAVVRGLEGVLTEPARSRGDAMGFEEAAASIAMTLERAGFAAGCLLAGGEEPLLQPLGDGLSICFRIELDHGYRVLTSAQAAAWGVHPERIYRAAVSVLFYRSGFGEAEPVDGAPGVTAWRMGDGFDAARILVLDALDWQRARAGLHVACPHPDIALLADSADAEAVRALARVAQAEHDAAATPLRTTLYRYEKARLCIDPAP